MLKDWTAEILKINMLILLSRQDVLFSFATKLKLPFMKSDAVNGQGRGEEYEQNNQNHPPNAVAFRYVVKLIHVTHTTLRIR